MPLDQSHPVEVEGIYNLWDFDVDAGYNFRNKKTGKKNLRSAILVELGEVPPPSGGALVGRQHRRPSSHHRRFSFVGFTTPAAASPSFRLQLHRGIIRSEAPTSSLPPQPRPLWSRRCQYLKKKNWWWPKHVYTDGQMLRLHSPANENHVFSQASGRLPVKIDLHGWLNYTARQRKSFQR